MEENEAGGARRPKRSLELGPAGEAVALRLQTIRKERRLTTEQLAAQVTSLGRTMQSTTITKIEKAQRRVDADDLVALALALNVSPLSLLFAQGSDSGQYNQLTTSVTTTGEKAWLWGTGQRAIAPWPGDDPEPERQEEYERVVQPPKLRWLKRQPAGRAADLLHEDAYRAIVESAFVTSAHPNRFRGLLTIARASVDRLVAELDRLEVSHAELVRGMEALESADRLAQGESGGEHREAP